MSSFDRDTTRYRSHVATVTTIAGVIVGMVLSGFVVPTMFGRFGEVTETGLEAPTTATPTGLSPSPPATSTQQPAAQPGGGSQGNHGPSASAGDATNPAASVGPLASDATSAIGPSGGPLRATDQGVTPTSVKLGVILLDIRALTPLGFGQPHFTPEEQRAQHQFFIDQANRAGGIGGRRIVPEFRTYNPLDSGSSSSAAAVCQQMADAKVFAVVGVIEATACMTQQHGLPTITNTGALAELYQRSRHLLVSPFSSAERGAQNWAALASASGLLRGHRLGTVHNALPNESRPESALVDVLKTNGHQVVYRANVSGDVSTGQSQMPVEVQKMKAAGVSAVFLVMNFVQAIQFVQTADKQGFQPQYLVGDLGSLTVEGLMSRMPQSFDGAYGWTQDIDRSPTAREPPADRRCRVEFNAATGNRYAAGNESVGLSYFCWMIKAFVAAATSVGPTLTRSGLAGAFQRPLAVDLPAMLGGSFGPGKSDFGDLQRLVRYSRSCSCYQSRGSGRRGPY